MSGRAHDRSRAIVALQGVSDRMTTLAQALSGSLVRPGSTYPDHEVAEAWHELRGHPALQWIPPIWRSTADTSENESRHAISALDRNLSVRIQDDGGQICIWLGVSPLVDREIAGGVDPTTPASAPSPQIGVTADTFERAVVELRDAVRARYGRASSGELPTTDRGQAG